jgi:Secretion system C-terminal sorting domain
MKKIYNFLVTLLFVSGSFTTVYGQLVFSESFNYTAGSSLSANGWTATSAQTGTQSIQNDPTFGVGNSVIFSTTTTASPLPTMRFDKALGSTVAGDGDANGDVYWLGFWMKVTGDASTYGVAAQVLLTNGATGVNTGTGITTDQRLGMGKTSNFTGASGLNAITAFTRASSGGCAAQNWPSAAVPTAPATAPKPALGTNYILMKITKGEFLNFNIGTIGTPVLANLDGVRVWVLTAPPTSEMDPVLTANGDFTTLDVNTSTTIPAQTRLLRSADNTGNTSCKKSGVDGIRIRVEGSTTGGLTVAFDEIRFAKGALSLVLPIDLLNFTAVKKAQGNVLTWTTASETNNKGFHIERSNDATNWKTIGYQKGAGESNDKLTYNFVDEGPLSISYYRLRQEDFDGRETLSKVISVEQKGKLNAILTPNPAKDVLNINIQNEVKNVAVAVYDMVGRSVLTSTFSGGQSALNVSNLTNGMYMIHIQSEGKTTIQKFIKD